MSNYTPTNKVATGVAIGSAIALLAWIGRTYFGIVFPAEQQAALQTLAIFAIQWSVTDV